MKTPTGSPNPIHHLLFAFSVLLSISINRVESATTPTQQQLLKGFSATPDSSISSFQPLLTDPTTVFSLGFLKLNRTQLALAILHIPSAQPVWFANTTTSSHSHLAFNGNLVLSDQHKRVIWSTKTNGDRLVLLNNSNLQIQKLESSVSSPSVLWQSFDFPSDTLLENQNFTSNMTLFSSNGDFSMKLGVDFLGLYSNLNQGSAQIYWKHTAMQAKAQIVVGDGPIEAQISSNGFLGMYQRGQEAPVDVLPFDSFQRPVSGIRRLSLESDGNLKGYYWNGSIWISDYTAIQSECELPNSCGSYGLCRPSNSCSCLDSRTEYHETEHQSGTCFPPQSGDFCSEKEDLKKGYWILRRKGVELPYKELMGFETMKSLDECEGSCEKNCSCWGAVFNNASGYCYKLDFPIGSFVGVEDERKLGYFKVRRIVKKKSNVRFAVGVVVLVVAGVLLVGAAGFGGYKFWRRHRRVNGGFMDDGMSPGPYRDLSCASFGSVELSKR